MENLSKKQWIILIFIIVIIIGVVGYYLYTNFQQISYENLEDDEFEEEIIENEIVKEEVEKIVVHIAGAVRKEGIVELNDGARIVDAINKAGGLNENADLSKVNLAFIISDGQKIYIPFIGEEAEISTESGENVIQGNNNDGGSNNSLVNINTANLSQLIELPGIGNSTAQKILDYRNENGKFKSIEDIKNVSGIGDSKFNNIKNFITVK